MKLVILAGGQKSTITGNEENIPKPMIDIGGRPLLWHIMKHASLCGVRDFIICGGYKIEQIKEYFRDFYIYQSDIAVNTKTNGVELLKGCSEDWNVIVADTCHLDDCRLMPLYAESALPICRWTNLWMISSGQRQILRLLSHILWEERRRFLIAYWAAPKSMKTTSGRARGYLPRTKNFLRR